MPDLPCRGGGGQPNIYGLKRYPRCADHFDYSNVGGGNYWWKKLFRAKFLCSCAFGDNIRSYTKQRARHGTPFLQPPPPSFGGRPCHPPPPQSNFQVAQRPTPCPSVSPDSPRTHREGGGGCLRKNAQRNASGISMSGAPAD